MMNQMIFANLSRRPVRSLVSIVAVAMEVAMILLIVGLTNGMVNDNRSRIQGVGADVVVRPSSSSMFMALAGNTLPLKMQTVLAQQPGVKAVAPVALQMNNKSLDTIGGIEVEPFDAVSGGFQFLKGGIFQKPYDVIVDDLYASSKKVRVGHSIPLLGHPFRVTGIFEHGKGSRLYIPLKTLGELTGTPGKVSVFYVKLADPSRTDAEVTQMEKILPNYKIEPMKQYLSLFTSAQMPGLPIFQHVMIGIAVIIGFLVIFLSMYTTILERTREIGILKSLGASKNYIVQAILRESGTLAALGIVVGTAGALLAEHLLSRVYPTLTIVITRHWILLALLIAVGGSIVGALYPAVKAARQDPIAALAYE